jgi:hypothetical protein
MLIYACVYISDDGVHNWKYDVYIFDDGIYNLWYIIYISK